MRGVMQFIAPPTRSLYAQDVRLFWIAVDRAALAHIRLDEVHGAVRDKAGDSGRVKASNAMQASGSSARVR